MKYLLLLTMLFGTVSLLSAQSLLIPEKLAIIGKGDVALLNGDWKEAAYEYEKICYLDTADPTGYLLRAAVLQAEMIDNEANIYDRYFPALLDSVRTIAGVKLQNCSPRDSALCYLYLGHQYAYHSLWEARFGSNFSALSYGLKAKREYHRGLAVDSTLYDLYFGLGSYHYWKSVKAGLLRTTGFFKDDRKKGIAEISLAVDSSILSRESALAALIWIMINEKDYDSALAIAEDMCRRFPGGNSFLWPQGEAFYKSGRYNRAAEIYDTLLARLKKHPGNYYNIIEALYWACNSYEKAGEKERRGQLAAYLGSIYRDIPQEIRRKQRGKLGYLRHGK
jgi:tetratricopeptide (TPR) repeat protein